MENLEEHECPDATKKARREYARYQKISVERLSGLSTPPSPKGRPKTKDELTISYVGGFLGCGNTLRGIIAEGVETFIPGQIRQSTHHPRSQETEPPAPVKPKASPEQIKRQRESVERLSTPSVSSRGSQSTIDTLDSLSSRKSSTNSYYIESDSYQKFTWRHVDGAKYCAGLFDAGPPNDPERWKSVGATAMHPSQHWYVSNTLPQPKTSIPAKSNKIVTARRQRLSVNRPSCPKLAKMQRSTDTNRPACRPFTQNEMSSMMHC